ncbi:MAG: hypothetical protein SGBAC_007689 [Bacillariaceae sp.]
MRLERVLFPEDVIPSWGKKASSCLGDISNHGGKSKARKRNRRQKKHRVGMKDESFSVLMNLDGNKPAKRTKKTSRSFKPTLVPTEQADSLSNAIGATQSSRPLNDSNTSNQMAGESLIHSFGATESLMFLGGINGNSRCKIAKSMLGRSSEPRRNKSGRVSKRARDFVTKLIQGTDSDGIVRDKRSSGSKSNKSETVENSKAGFRLKDKSYSGKPSQQQQKARRQKRQRDSTEVNKKKEDDQELNGGEPVKPASNKRHDNGAAEKSKRATGKKIKFSEQNEGRNRSKGKLEVSSGGLGALCGLKSNGYSFPVPNPVLNRSVLVSPLTVESLDCSGGRKDEGRRRKATRKSSKRSVRTNAKTKDDNMRDKKKATRFQQRSGMGEKRKIKLLSAQRDEKNETTQIDPKHALEQQESERESICTSQSPEMQTETPKQVSLAAISRDGDELLSRSVPGPIHNMRKKTKSLEKGPLSSKAHTTKLSSLSHTWTFGSPSDMFNNGDALTQGAGSYVIEVEEADLSIFHKSLSGAFQQRHQVAERSRVSKDSNLDCKESTPKGASSVKPDSKEGVEKKPDRRKRSSGSMDEADCDKTRDPEARRSGLSIEVDVKPSARSAKARKLSILTAKEDKTAAEPTLPRRSPRLQTPDNSDSDKENNETAATGIRRSRRSVGRPRRLGEYAGDDDSTYVETPSARSASTKRRTSATSVRKQKQKPNVLQEKQSEEDPERKTFPWKEDEVVLLREAQKEVDPKSYSYWQDVSGLVGTTRTAEECQEKWFSLVKTPNVRQKKKKGNARSKAIPISPQDDDIFDATPMKALFSISCSDKDPLLGSMEFLTKLNLGSAVKVERVPVEHESNTLATTRGYKSYIRDMKREMLAKDKKKKAVLNKQKSSKAKNVREQAGEGDIELKGRLSPGGTLHMTSNVDEDIDMRYDMDEECDDDDDDAFFPRVQI